MINQNLWHLRSLALRVFSALIEHCRSTSEVTAEIKATRLGLQRISSDYISGLSRLYLSSVPSLVPSSEPLLVISDPDRKQLLLTL
jgi:hypothetical protein